VALPDVTRDARSVPGGAGSSGFVAQRGCEVGCRSADRADHAREDVAGADRCGVGEQLLRQNLVE
jgi:hypothetical protein